jgi:OHCU decarboxylase
MELHTLNTAPIHQFLELIGGPLEGQTWLAERIAPQRPFATVQDLIEAFQVAIQGASESEKIALITSHPDLAGKAMIDNTLSATSQQEQAAAGLNRLTPTEFDQFHQFNNAYKQTFGFPFVICARENTKDSILGAFATRLAHLRADEIAIGVGEVFKILRLRLLDVVS